VDDEVRRLLRGLAEDETLPASAVSDAELVERCSSARTSLWGFAAGAFAALRRTIGSIWRRTH
jgi:hypothetical protein